MQEKSCNDFDNVFSFLKKIRDGEIVLEKVKKNQNEFKSDLTEIKSAKRIK